MSFRPKHWERAASPADYPALGARCFAGCLAFCLFLSGAVRLSAAPPAGEVETKAGFLFALLRYTEWPAASLEGTNSPIVITICGHAAVAEHFQGEYGGRTVLGRPLVVRRLKSVALATNQTHVLFIGADRMGEFPDLLTRLPKTGILTVGETQDFIERGGMLGLVLVEKNVQVHVNLPAVEGAGIRLGSGLLGSAKKVRRK